MRIPLETRLDPRRLAECLIFLRGQNALPLSRSAAVSACIELLSDILRREQLTVEIESDDRAIMLLENFFKGRSTVDISQISLKQDQTIEELAKNFNGQGEENA